MVHYVTNNNYSFKQLQELQGSVNKDGVYKGFESPHQIAQEKKKEIQALRETITNDPNMSISEKRTKLETLDRSEKHIDDTISNATSEGGITGPISVLDLSKDYFKGVHTNDYSNRNEADLNETWNSLEKGTNILNDLKTSMGQNAGVQTTYVDPPPSSRDKGPNYVVVELNQNFISQVKDSVIQKSDKTSEVSSSKDTTVATKSGSVSKDEKAIDNNQSDDAKAAAQEAAYQANFAGKQPEELADMASKDPKQFYENLRGLSPEDRQSTMMMMNQYLQDMNQMFSMMSNLSKAQHDTAKALIGNMRV